MVIYTPYTYLIGWTNSTKYYYGVRYAQGCHPDDFWAEYFTSSVYVDEQRELYGEPDIIQIRRTFTGAKSAIAWENKVNKRMGVVNDDKWLNKANWPAFDTRGRTLSEETKRNMSVAAKGKPKSEEHKRNMSVAAKGKPKSEKHKQNISKGRKGIKLSDEHRQNISKGRKGIKHSDKRIKAEYIQI